MYGYTNVETPVLSAFRKEAILFEKAYSHVPLTLPSHGTIFTGTLPAVNGLRDNLGYRLNAKLPTAAELLKKAGYDTGGAVSSMVLNAGSGIARGFDFWEDTVEPKAAGEALSRVQRSGAETESLLAAWVDQRSPGRPFFAFLHLYEPHSPYAPPEPYASRYRGHEYDGEIAYSDELVGRFFDVLKRKGIWDRALVIVLSDHGEGLGDHGEDEHGIFLYRFALEVPLMVKLPKGDRAGASVGTPVQLSDVFTTIVEAAAIPDVTVPAGTVSLLDVAAGARPKRTIYAETLFPRIHFGWSDLASLLDLPWQYIEAPRPELYDLSKDPAENENLASGKPAPFRTLRIEMEKRRAAFTAPSEVSPEEAKKLASLGYLSSGATEGTGPLPDPKDDILLVHDWRRAATLFLEGQHDEALAAFRGLLEKYPRMWDVSDVYSQALQRIGRDEEALAVLKRGVEASPAGAAHGLVVIADLCLKLGKLDEARKYAESARDRGDPGAGDVLARTYLAEKKWDKAESEASDSLRTRPNRRQPYLVLARVELERNELPRALALLDFLRFPGEGQDPRGLRTLHVLRGEILRRMKRLIEAEAEFREEIRLFPKDLDAYVALADLCAAEGRQADAREALRRMIEASPVPEAFFRAIRTLLVAGDPSEAESVRRAAASRYPLDRRFSRKV
jgi:choline-sulfatase